MLRKIVVSASFFLIVARVPAEQCKQKPNRSGGLFCTEAHAACSPVSVGSGTTGNCQTQGVGDGQSCECVGKLGFSIRLSPRNVTLIQGRSVSTLVVVEPDAGFNGTVALAISNLPPGTSAVFVPSIVSGPRSSSSTLTISATPTAKLGLDIVVVEGTSGNTKENTSLELTLNPPPNAQLWGFADLHTHPASFLGFGSDANGDNGLFWGKPGMELSSSSTDTAIAADLPICPAATHAPHNDPDIVRSGERSGIINNLDQTVPQWPHGAIGKIFAGGQPSFENWPAALSLEHQQMHVTEIRRAYDGGLRLLFASATDNELLHDLWNTGFNAGGNPIPTPTGTYDYECAKKQLEFIKSFAAANSSWMQIVTSAAEAREAIRQDKLAIVLSLELDSLWGDQILDLASQFGVRHVIAVHLSNNTIGGTAAYEDLWNANSFFLTGEFLRVRTNKCVSFRLALPQHLTHGPVGAIQPAPIDASWFASLGYGTDANLGGHENDRGLNVNEFRRLMNAGLLLDIVHMGHKSADGALALGEQYDYPLMDSHTGLRDDTDCSRPAPAGVTERSLPFSQVVRIAKLGGVLGLGTETNNTADAVATWVDKYMEALNLMGGKGVALGTDTDGLSPQIFNNFYNLPTSYPVTVQTLFGAPAEAPQQLPKFKLLSKTFDFSTDGLAHYGLLPDFFQAVHDHPAASWSHCMGQCQSCAAACNLAVQGDTNQCLQSCQAQFPTPSPVPNPAAPQVLKAIYHSAKDVLDMWDKTEAAAVEIPLPEGVQCSVFDLDAGGPTKVAGPSDAIFVSPVLNEKKRLIGRLACVPDKANGTCRKFFGLCSTTSTNSTVKFSIFNDGDQDRIGSVTQLFFDTAGRACISGESAIAPDGTCRKWFGDAATADAREVACSVFDDGYSAPIGKSSAIFVAANLSKTSDSFDSCLPTGPNGVCRKWFGRCIAWPSVGR